VRATPPIGAGVVAAPGLVRIRLDEPAAGEPDCEAGFAHLYGDLLHVAGGPLEGLQAAEFFAEGALAYG